MSELSPFRIAIRQEGGVINAYLSPMASMRDAVLVASINKGLCEQFPPLFEEFKALVSGVAVRFFEDVFGDTPRIDVRAAPEHERAGNA